MRLDAQTFVGGTACGSVLRKATVAFKCVGSDGVSEPRLRYDGEPSMCSYVATLYVDCRAHAEAPGTLCLPVAVQPNSSALPLGAVFAAGLGVWQKAEQDAYAQAGAAASEAIAGIRTVAAYGGERAEARRLAQGCDSYCTRTHPGAGCLGPDTARYGPGTARYGKVQVER
jgi:hypothetical protein